MLILGDIIEKNIESSAEAFLYFGIKVDGRHQVLGDCLATVELFEKLLSLIKKSL